MKIEHRQLGSKGSYFIDLNESRVAEMTYSIAGSDRIIIDHTEVDDAHRGEGLGEILVRRAVDDARTEGIIIVPLCPFARAIFNKNQELRDVL